MTSGELPARAAQALSRPLISEAIDLPESVCVDIAGQAPGAEPAARHFALSAGVDVVGAGTVLRLSARLHHVVARREPQFVRARLVSEASGERKRNDPRIQATRMHEAQHLIMKLKSPRILWLFNAYRACRAGLGVLHLLVWSRPRPGRDLAEDQRTDASRPRRPAHGSGR